MIKIFLGCMLVFILGVSANALVEYDLKLGMLGNGGFGLGGGLGYFLNQDTEIRPSIYYAQLGGFSGAFYPLFVNVIYKTRYQNYPVYFGGGLNYFLGSPTKNNAATSGGIGFQALAGIEHPISAKMSLNAEIGSMMVQAKQGAGGYVSSFISYLGGGIRFSPFGRSLKGYNLKLSDSTLSYDDYLYFKLIPDENTKVSKVTVIFDQNQKLGLKKENHEWVGRVKITRDFKKGLNTSKIYIKFDDESVSLEKPNFEIK